MLNLKDRNLILKRIKGLEDGILNRAASSLTEHAKVTIKALNFILKFGYLPLRCTKCDTSFFCSGSCLYTEEVRDVYVFKKEKGKCLCAKCDRSGTTWIGKCKKRKNSLFYVFAYFTELQRKKERKRKSH